LHRVSEQLKQRVKLSGDEISKLLKKMQLVSKTKDESTIIVEIPSTRSDIFHECDVMEDVAIAYGFNNIERTIPNLVTIGKQTDMNKFTELLRNQIANAGYTEILTLVLCSKDENYSMLNKEEDNLAVELSNPKTIEFQIIRTMLLPGSLKTLKENLKMGVPIKLFEISDVVLIDNNMDVGAKNHRKFIALYCDTTSKFEEIHGLLDRFMEIIGIKNEEKNGYSIESSEGKK
jgi:phenylalanyl-tRNA synthetase beta chain